VATEGIIRMEKHSPTVYTVSELTQEIQKLVEARFDFIWVEGEISNFSSPASGHYYMVLKDENAQLRTVMFRPQARYLKFLPENGMKVIAQGRIGIYAPRGEYQMILDYLEPVGVGALAKAFEQLKQKLAAQGVFDEDIKKPLPYLPQRIAVITSPTGAALRDFLKVIRRRFANMEIIVVPVRVQGAEAPTDMVQALDLVNRELPADVIVLTRGGGSLEDLWAFNDEALALAIRQSRIPVVSAVGHEIDMTISDMAADFRAPTPSAAAELLVAEKESLQNRLDELRDRMVSRLTYSIETRSHQLNSLRRGLRDPRKRLSDGWLRLDDLHSRLLRGMKFTLRDLERRLTGDGRALLLHSPMSIVASMKQRLDFLQNSLGRGITAQLSDMRGSLRLMERRVVDLNPTAILNRGYSITVKLPENRILRSASICRKGERVHVRLAKGGLECTIDVVKSE
jgi:exodeoxyribonuclease VII large subunit